MPARSDHCAADDTSIRRARPLIRSWSFKCVDDCACRHVQADEHDHVHDTLVSEDQLRYVAGADAKATYAMRLQLGDEAFRKAMRQQFFGVGSTM